MQYEGRDIPLHLAIGLDNIKYILNNMEKKKNPLDHINLKQLCQENSPKIIKRLTRARSKHSTGNLSKSLWKFY